MAQKFLTDIELTRGLKDSSGDLGSSGQVLSSTGTGTNWITNEANSTVVYQDGFTGDNSTVDFTLSVSVTDENVTQVYIDGVYQTKDTYSVSNTTLTLSTAPPLNADIEVITFSTATTADDLQAGVVVIPVKNTHTASIAKGEPVYITGNVGNSARLQIAPADASNSAKMPSAGLLLQTLAVNAEGYIVTGGYLRNLTTDVIDGTSTSSNMTVYVKAGGGLTMTKPTGVNYIQNIAKVARVHATNGSLVVSSILRTNDVPTPLYIDHANQRLGIGTDSPSSILHLEGGGGNDKQLRLATSPSTYWDIGRSNQTGHFEITEDTGDTYFLINKDNGNVGIGTTSPSATLDVRGSYFQRPNSNTSGVWQLTDSGGTLRARFDLDAAGDSSLLLRNGSGTYTTLINSDGNSYLNGGNVGIGTTSPSNTTHIYKNATIGVITSPTTANAGLRIEDNGSNMYFDGNSIILDSTGYITTSGSSDFYIGTNSAERMRIDSSGNVGIGTDSPNERLPLNVGDSGTNYLQFTNSTTGTGPTDGMLVGLGNGEEATIWQFENDHMRFGTNNSERMRIDSQGRVGIGTSSPAAGAVLDISATNRGVLLPRLTTTQINTIQFPENGLMVYNTTLNTICFYNGSSWQKVSTTNM